MDTGSRKTVTISQAQVICNVSRRTIYNWMGTGKVQFVRTPGGSPRLFVDTLFKPAARTSTTDNSSNSPTV